MRRLFFSLLAIMALLSACKKIDNSTTPGQPADLTTTVTAGYISGFVTNESNNPVQGATVKIGGSTIITDEYGFFEASNVLVVKQAATVTVIQAGYYKGIKTFMAEEGKGAFFRIKLLPKSIAGTVNASSGGTVTSTTGVKIVFPANAVVNASTNIAYTGTVNVAATWLDPTSPELNSIMPGDLRGIDAGNTMKLLTTYGMVAVELTGSSGELLQLASGKKAGLTFPIPSSILATAPASIPLWSFDEEKGLWIEEGSAIKTGNTYVGDVGHFSFWNCDIPTVSVMFQAMFKYQNGNPLSYVAVKISVANSPENNRIGYTDINGFVSGLVPGNEDLKLEVITNPNCSSVFTKNFSTTSGNISWGEVNINTPTNLLAQVSGSVTNCNGGALSNGFIMVNNGNTWHRFDVINGTYNFPYTLCNGPQLATFVAGDEVALTQNTTPLTFTINSGNNTVPNIYACGSSINEYFNLIIDGDTIDFHSPADTFYNELSGPTTAGVTYLALRAHKRVTWPNSNATLVAIPTGTVNMGGSGLGNFGYFKRINLTDIHYGNRSVGIMVNITEFGPVGSFISGNFSDTVICYSCSPIVPAYARLNFRVRRYF